MDLKRRRSRHQCSDTAANNWFAEGTDPAVRSAADALSAEQRAGAGASPLIFSTQEVLICDDELSAMAADLPRYHKFCSIRHGSRIWVRAGSYG